MYSAFAMELSDISKPFKFARLNGFERLENRLTKGTYERFWKVKQLSEQTYLYHRGYTIAQFVYLLNPFKGYWNVW